MVSALIRVSCSSQSTIETILFSPSEENSNQAKTMRIATAEPTIDSSNDEDSEEEESLGKVVTKMGKEIDRKSAGNIKRSKEEVKADLEVENEYGYTDSKSIIPSTIVEDFNLLTLAECRKNKKTLR